MFKGEDLLEKTREGELTQEEFNQIVEAARDGPYDENLYVLIHILGKVGFGEELREIVEKFLYYPDDPAVSEQALKALCEEWGLTSKYLEQIKNFIRGESWDVNENVRMLAISIAGEYIKETSDKELLMLLLDVFENLGTSNSLREFREYSRDLIQGCAYFAILIAMGKDWDELPDQEETDLLIRQNRLSELDQEALAKAYRMIQ